jgi:hypothetical protein
MSRWLRALLAGVVLVAIAAVFWIDQTSVLPPVSRGTTPVAPVPSPASTAQNAAPSAPSSPSPPAAPEAAAPRAPTPAPALNHSKPPRRRPRRPPRRPRLRPSSPRNLRLLPLRWPNHPCRLPRPDGRRRKSRAYMRPRAWRSWSGPGLIPRRIASGFSSGAAAAGPIGSRWTSSPRPRLSSRRRGSFCLPRPAASMARLTWKARSR